MTVLVGVRCTDGIVIGADSMATSAHGTNPVMQIPSGEKLRLIGNKAILAATGAVGLSQRIRIIADRMWEQKQFNGTGMTVAKAFAGQCMTDFGESKVQMSPQHGLGFGALLAMVVGNEPYLVEFASTDFQPEIKVPPLFYVSMGSGQALADPFLAFVDRVLWKRTMPNVETAKIGVFWALYHTIQLAPGGVGGDIRIGVVRKVGIDWKAEILADTGEQAQHIALLESRITLAEPDAPTSDPPKIADA